MIAPNIRLVNSRMVIRNAFTRLPFRFGVVTMEAAPVGLLELEIEFKDGVVQKGIASDFLAYKWFDKAPEKTPADNVADLLQAVRDARSVYSEAAPDTPYNLWLSTRKEIEMRSLARGFNRLGASFAASMMERAIIDAVGRHIGYGFDRMVRSNALGIVPEALFSEISFEQMIDALPPRPLDRVSLRHTVGLVDPISVADIDIDAPDDGLPVALEQYLAVDKLNYLKVKVGGDLHEDIDRLAAIARVVELSGRPMQMTLDGNEQYMDLDAFATLVERIQSTPRLEKLWDSVIFIEQPLHRDVAMTTPLSEEAKRVIKRPLLIDEADGWAEAFRDAIELGYEGVSHKNCKGVYRSLINAGLARQRNEAIGENRYFLSAEDLTNLATVPLQADLAVVATLGITHVERNGHHYFTGLNHLPAPECKTALQNHAPLYQRAGNSGILRICDGNLDLTSLQAPGLGGTDHPNLNDAIAETDWCFSMLER